MTTAFKCEPDDLTGVRFGRLVAEWPTVAIRRDRVWRCRCDCGRTFEAREVVLKAGRTLSCGCVGAATVHGMSTLRDYNIWKGMIARCHDRRNKSYGHYGRRGIEVCARWRDFAKFFQDMGPSNGLSIDRIDNSKGYEPGNCRWATEDQQIENRSRKRVVLQVGDRQMTIAQFARERGISPQTAYNWLRRKNGLVKRVD